VRTYPGANGGLVMYIDDVTDRELALQRLAESEQRFHHVALATSDAIWDWTCDSQAVWWSDGIQALFGHDPEVMRSGAEIAAEAGADLIDINMGCPVPKVRKTGAGAQLLRDQDLALALARGAAEGSGLPVTVKLRSGIEAGDRSGFELAVRLVEEAGVAAIAFHPRVATKGHKGSPDYALARELVERIEAPVIISGGLSSAAAARRAYEESGAAAVMIARGSFGNPWVFEELTGRRAAPPSREEMVAEWLWVLDRAAEHLGEERAERYLRKFHPWYAERLEAPKEVAEELQRSADLARARELIGALATPAGVA